MMPIYTSNYPKFSYSEASAKSLENPDEVGGPELNSVLRASETSAPPLRGICFLVFSCEFCKTYKITFFCRTAPDDCFGAGSTVLVNETVNYDTKTKA